MSVKNKIWIQIQSHEHGWAFGAKDFLVEFKRTDIDTALFHLEKENKIRKIHRGIYDCPYYSEILRQFAAPDIDQAARAIARNYGRELQVTGNVALNSLGLSTQIPVHSIYLWNAPSREFQIGNQILRFQNARRQYFTPKLPQSRLLVQAIKALEDNATDPVLQAQIKKCFTPEIWKMIKTDTAYVPAGIRKTINHITE